MRSNWGNASKLLSMLPSVTANNERQMLLSKNINKWAVHPAEPMLHWRTEFLQLRSMQSSQSLKSGRDECQSLCPPLAVRMDCVCALQNAHLTGGLWRNQKSLKQMLSKCKPTAPRINISIKNCDQLLREVLEVNAHSALNMSVWDNLPTL